MVNYEIKSQLAKLLATEDLVVEHHKGAETAQFNVETRVLTLPMWKMASEFVYDMLVAHEVGHALYTPCVDWIKNRKISPSIVNVVEDARIEKMMKRRYGGLNKTFYRGYSDLQDQDFFEVEDKDISEMNLADRINLYFKIGNFIDIPFNDEEKVIVGLVSDCETFDEVLEVSQKIHDYCKSTSNKSEAEFDPLSNKKGEMIPDENVESEDDTEGEDGEKSEEMSDEDGSSLETSEKEESIDEDVLNSEPEAETMNTLEEKMKEMNRELGRGENVYIERPEYILENYVTTNEEIHNYIQDFWHGQEPEWFDNSDKLYFDYKKSSTKEVNYLVKEFECRKSADAYARASVSKTGVLDCSKLHTYKYNEDIFKKVNVIPDGKNHGLIFILDWSGSMATQMLDTVKQLYNLVWFCRKVNIPYDVYFFTNAFGDWSQNPEDFPTIEEENKFSVSHDEHLINILTSKVSNRVCEIQMKNFWRIVHSLNSYHSYSFPPKMCLGGTPLNEALMSLHQIIPQFKHQHKLQKVQCVVLTDGEAGMSSYNSMIHYTYQDEPKMCRKSIFYTRCYFRNRNTGFTYEIQNFALTDVILKDLGQSFPDVNFIGIRLCSNGEIGRFMNSYYKNTSSEEYVRDKKVWKKEKSLVIKNSGYKSYIVILNSSLQSDVSFEVKEDATKTQIKTAFQKSLKSKKMNKKILNEFISLVS